MAVNKVEYGGETLIDLTEDTVTPETLAEGITAHDASGEQIVGTMKSNSNTNITNLKSTVWKLNDALLIREAKSYNVNFDSKGENYTQFNLAISVAAFLQYVNANTSVSKAVCYGNPNTGTTVDYWVDAGYKWVTFTGGDDATNIELINWLYDNGEFQGYDSSSSDETSNGFEMPQIRFANQTQGYLYPVSEEHPLKLSIEIVGGGELQVGDQLQICRSKNYTYNEKDENGNVTNRRKKKKLYRFAEYIVTEEDLGKRFLTLTITGVSERANFSLNHSGRCDGGRFAQRFLRIRRSIGDMQNNDSGMTVDARFSNVVPIWWTYTNNCIRIQ